MRLLVGNLKHRNVIAGVQCVLSAGRCFLDMKREKSLNEALLELNAVIDKLVSPIRAYLLSFEEWLGKDTKAQVIIGKIHKIMCHLMMGACVVFLIAVIVKTVLFIWHN